MADLTKADLQARLAELEAELAQAKAAVQTPAAANAKPWPESLIITEAECAALTSAQQKEFRLAGGTVTSNPITEPKE